MDLLQQLQRVPVFQLLPVESLQAIAGICEERRVPAGTVLVRQADIGANFHLIASGEAIVHRVNDQGLRRPVGALRAGDYFGVTSLFLGAPRDATVTASSDMQYWVIHRAAFESLLEARPDIRHELAIPPEIQQQLRAPRFSWMNPGELVVLQCRRHWLVFVRQLVPSTLVLIALAALMIVPVALDLLSPRWLWGLAILALTCVLIALWHWFDWRNDYFVVTTHRITHRERIVLLYESREEMPIDRVQNINVERKLLGSLFHFGTLSIETAAKMGKLVFTHIPRPEHMRETILQQLERARATRRAAERLAIRSEMAQSLNLHASAVSVESAADREQPATEFTLADAPKTEPGGLVRALNTLAQLGLLPRTRVETDESITWRKHWVFLLREAIPALLIGSLFAIFTIMGLFRQPALLHDRAPWYWQITLGLAIVSLGRFGWGAADWANDEYIVTDERIIDIDKRPLFFSEQRREAPLGMIQNISLRKPNLIAAIFNYGDVVVQTAGTESFTFERVPNPSDVQREIFRRMDAYREVERKREAAFRRAEMAEWFNIYQEVGGEISDGVACLRGDGSWRLYTPKDGLIAGDVRALAHTPDGSVWIGTNKGVSRRTRLGNWESLNTRDGLVNDDVHAIALAPDGSVWFGTTGGASRLSRHRIWQSYTTHDGLAGDSVSALAVAPDGTIWLGTDHGLSRLSPNGEWRTYDATNGLRHDQVLSLALAPDYSLWVGTWGGVSHLEIDGEREIWTQPEGLPPSVALCLAAPADGSLWIGTNFGASHLYPDDERSESYSTRHGLPGNIVWTIAVTRDGAVWFGTEAGAGLRSPDGLWRTYTQREGLASDTVKVISVAADGSVWLG